MWFCLWFCLCDRLCYLFTYVEPALHSRDEGDLIVMDKFFDVLLNLIFQYFIENFCIDVHQEYWPEVFFLFFFNLQDNFLNCTLGSGIHVQIVA